MSEVLRFLAEGPRGVKCYFPSVDVFWRAPPPGFAVLPHRCALREKFLPCAEGVGEYGEAGRGCLTKISIRKIPEHPGNIAVPISVVQIQQLISCGFACGH
jgi:hypothetical protein